MIKTETNEGAITTDSRVIACIIYVIASLFLYFTYIIGMVKKEYGLIAVLIVWIIAKVMWGNNKYICFHAFRSLLWYILFWAVGYMAMVLTVKMTGTIELYIKFNNFMKVLFLFYTAVCILVSLRGLRISAFGFLFCPKLRKAAAELQKSTASTDDVSKSHARDVFLSQIKKK